MHIHPELVPLPSVAAASESLHCVRSNKSHPSGSVRRAPGSYKVLRQRMKKIKHNNPALYANSSANMCVPILLSLAEKHLDILIEDIMLTRFLQIAGTPTQFVAVVAQPGMPDENFSYILLDWSQGSER